MKTCVDINCDMGEGFGRWRIGDTPDEALFPFITSANIAAGFHAGDPCLIDATVRMALRHGCGIGAHPGYNDLQGFGRRKINGTQAEIVADLIYQVGAVREFCRRHGTTLQHVKPHGAVYMELADNPELARPFLDYLAVAAPELPVFCMGGSRFERLAREMAQPVVCEFYADRDYGDDGFIVFTREAGTADPDAIAQKCLLACREGKVRTVNGKTIPIAFESICLHSDTLGSGEIARAIKSTLRDAGVQLQPISQTAR